MLHFHPVLSERAWATEWWSLGSNEYKVAAAKDVFFHIHEARRKSNILDDRTRNVETSSQALSSIMALTERLPEVTVKIFGERD